MGQKEHNLIVPSPEDEDNPLTRAIISDKDGVINSVKCAVCQSKHRIAIEEMFEKNTSINLIKNFLDEKGESHTLWRIRYHLYNHYKSMATQCAIAEYRDNLSEMMKRRKDTATNIEHAIGIAWIEISRAVAIQTDGNIEREQIRSKMISDAMKLMLEACKELNSMADSDSKVRALDERYNKVWQMRIQSAKTEEERNLLYSTLKDFHEVHLQLGPLNK